MGLLDKEIYVGVNNKEYYIKKGYIIPTIEKTYYYKDGRKDRTRFITPKNTKIKVKIEDVPLQSNAKVNVECDCCKKKYIMKYQDYNLHNHNGKIYCKKCFNTILASGSNNSRWNYNLSQEERINKRKTEKDTIWKKKIFARDNYTCQKCRKQSNLIAHHLNSYNWCVKERYMTENGICLCQDCHKNFHSIYGYGNNTKEQFFEWLNKKLEILPYNGRIKTCKTAYCVEDNEIIYNVKKYAKEKGLNDSCIYGICNKKKGIYTHKSKHFMWYEDFLKENKGKE